jgi:hypothetical protein
MKNEEVSLSMAEESKVMRINKIAILKSADLKLLFNEN